MAEQQWKLEKAARNSAMTRGEEIARLNGFETWPVDPFKVIESEGDQIHAEGDDFRDSFDGRLSYHDGRFLLIFNTRYNAWSRKGRHHPKVRFTVSHELGHYYLDRHREFLVRHRKPIESFTEFESDKQIERQADAFAVGLLMPKYLVSPCINCEPDATMTTIKKTADDFDVSFTSMMVRWTQLSHFPCATLCIRHGKIQWGFASDTFRSSGLWKTKRGVAPTSGEARAFVDSDPTCTTFREGVGIGWAQYWLEGDCSPVDVQEFYMTMPYSQCVIVFITAREDDLPSAWDGEE